MFSSCEKNHKRRGKCLHCSCWNAIITHISAVSCGIPEDAFSTNVRLLTFLCLAYWRKMWNVGIKLTRKYLGILGSGDLTQRKWARMSMRVFVCVCVFQHKLRTRKYVRYPHVGCRNKKHNMCKICALEIIDIG